MIRCNKCGYENNDGSQVCLNCREKLAYANLPLSDAKQYIQTNQESIAAAEQNADNVKKKTSTMCVIIVLALVIGIAIYFSNLYTPVVDDTLLGTWQSSGYGYLDTWTFEKDGTYQMTRTFSNNTVDGIGSENYYRAENGTLKTSFSRNVNDYTTATYEYQFGVTGDGTQCLILTHIQSGGVKSTELLYRVD